MVSYDPSADHVFVSVLCGRLLISTDVNESLRHSDEATVLTVQCSNRGRGKIFF